MSRIRIIIKTSIEYGIKGTYLLKVTENSTSNSVFNVNSQPVFKTLLLTQLHLNEKESGWVHRMTDWLAMFCRRDRRCWKVVKRGREAVGESICYLIQFLSHHHERIHEK